MLGEPREIFTEMFLSELEATQGMECLPFNTINKENTGISRNVNKVINQINLMIAKTKETTVLSGSQLLLRRSLWNACLSLFPFAMLGEMLSSILTIRMELLWIKDNYSKAASPAEEVMKQIKEDITASEKHYPSDYSFKYGRYYWSMAATQMLKGEVYL